MNWRGLIIGFSLLLCSCGGSQSTLLSDVSASSPSPNPGIDNSGGNAGSSDATQPNLSAAKSVDSQLENFAAQINSDQYAGKIVVQIYGSCDVSSLGPDVTADLLFGKDPKLLKNMVRQLEVVSGKTLPDLNAFYKVSLKDSKKAEALLRRLWKQKCIQSIYPRLYPQNPGILSIPDLSGSQGYLYSFASTGGLGFDAAWARGLKGNGVRITDVECNWNPDHEDLPRQSGLVSSTGIGCHPTAIAHGTAVLGILVGVDADNHGIKGTAPHTSIQTAWGDCVGVGTDSGGLANILNRDVKQGDITLCEQSYDGPSTVNPSSNEGQPGTVLPEVWPDEFAGIKVSSAMGFITIQPSGNGSVNLDSPSTYFPNGPDLRVQDSGAIVVGASMGGTNRARAVWSNCGGRVNVHAWGSGVVTTSYPGVGYDWLGNPPPFNNDPNQPNTYYTNAFGGTSSAAAMVAGAAAILQSYAKQQMGGKKFLTPEKAREILVQSGVPPESDGGCKIGVQPRVDLALQIFDAYWNNIKQTYPELTRGEEIKGARRKALRNQGVGLVCKLYDPTNSDPSCPETAKCVLQTGYQIQYRCDSHAGCGFDVTPPQGQGGGYNDCKSTLCLPIDVSKSDYDCSAGAIWPAGLKTAKQLDFDGDGKADLVNWTANGWKISLSSKSSFGDGFGAWDIQINPPRVPGRWVWPVVEDYNRDGRADLAVYDKEHGIWYIKFTDKNILSGRWTDWDWQITLPYHDELNRDVRQTKYARPLPGDYNNDGYIDLALARSDGIWSIDFGGPNRSDYGAFDQNVNYLTAVQLAAAPGWGYLPVHRAAYSTIDYDGGVFFKTPDGITESGQMWNVYLDGSGRQSAVGSNNQPITFGGNEVIPLKAWGSESKSFDGNWLQFDEVLERFVPSNVGSVFGSLDCHPFIADFDGDEKPDRAVQCPNEFRIVLSANGVVQHIPLGYTASEFSLPGKIYVGGISYQTSQQLIDYQMSVSNDPPVIPVDMVQGNFCTIPWQPNKRPLECR